MNQLVEILSLVPPDLLRTPLDGLSFWVGSVQVTLFVEDGLYGAELEEQLEVVWETRAATPEQLLSQLSAYLSPSRQPLLPLVPSDADHPG